MEPGKTIALRLFSLTPVDAKDELDERYDRCYSSLLSLISGVSEKKAHDALNAEVCKGAQIHEDISLGLLVGVLSDPGSAPQYYRDLTFITRDGLKFVLSQLNQIILEKYTKLNDSCRQQILWVVKEMIKNSVVNCDLLCFNLLRQIAGGDISQKNIWLAESLLDLFIENRLWLEKIPDLVATIVYTYLRLILDHGGQIAPIMTLRQREVDFCISLLREKFPDCMMIGRDLVRLLQNVARIPEFEKLWKDLLGNPTTLCPTFTGVLQLLTTRTSRRFLQCRLTPDMERKIVFLTSSVKFGQQKRYQDWFQRQYLTTPESQSLRCDLIRFICGVIHPSNEALCSDIIPRWAVIGWLLTTCTSNVAASNAKLSLFYDWLFFDPEKDNIMNIEPAILVMYHSMRPHPAITATLLDFLCRIMPNFCIPLALQVKQGIFTSLRQILEKRVLPSLSPLFDNPKLDRELRSMIKESFAEFCSNAEVKQEDTLPMGREPPVMFLDTNHSVLSNNTENEAQFSEDEDDIPLGKLKIKETKFRPIQEVSEKTNSMDMTETLDVLNGEIRDTIITMQNEKDNEARCEIMEKLLQKVLQENSFDQDMAVSLGGCLSTILNDEIRRKIFPEHVDDESIEDSIGSPTFVMFRNLCQTPEEDPSRQPLLMILTELATLQPRLGYLLLYFVKVSRISDDKMSSYRDYVKSFESKDLSSSLLSDLKLCQEDDVRLFCYLVPSIYIQFPTIAIGNAELLNLIVSCIDSAQLQDLVCHILQGNVIMFRKDSFLSILNASLEWDTFEQFCLWQLIAAHNIPVDYVLPILPKLEFQAHAEALTSILLLLKQVRYGPSEDLLRHIMCRDVKPTDQFVVSILKYWCQENEDKLADMISTQLGRSCSLTNKRKRQATPKTQNPTLEQTLAHLDHLRQCLQASTVQSSKPLPLFSQDAIQAALLQVQQCCTEAQKSRYSDLFALAEDLEDVKPVKIIRTSGRSKGNANTTSFKNTTKIKPTMTDSETEFESSGDEDIIKPKGPRKKKKMSVVGSDSD